MTHWFITLNKAGLYDHTHSAAPAVTQDTCRVPCSVTWPCFAACTPAGCQPAGRPISGPGLSVSVRVGSGSYLTTSWWSPVSSPLPTNALPFLLQRACAPPPAPPLLRLISVPTASLFSQSLESIWGRWWRPREAGRRLCETGRGPTLHAWVALSATPPPKSFGSLHQMTCKENEETQKAT